MAKDKDDKKDKKDDKSKDDAATVAKAISEAILPVYQSQKKKNTGKIVATVLVGVLGTIVIWLMCFGRSPAERAQTAVTQQAIEQPRLAVPEGAVVVHKEQEVLPPVIRAWVGTKWYSPYPHKPVSVWACPYQDDDRKVKWQMRYTYLDNSMRVVDMDPTKDGGSTWPDGDKAIKLVEYRVTPDQVFDGWEFEFHLGKFTGKM